MKTELTSFIEEAVVEVAEKLDSGSGHSLSESVEVALQKVMEPLKGKSLVKQLRGSAAGGPLNDLTYEEIREEYAKYELKKHHPDRRHTG